MLKNHFIKIIFSVLSSSIVILASCSPPIEDHVQNVPTPEEVKAALTQLSDGVSSLSQTVATSINTDPEIMAIIYDEVSKRFDGDSEALLSTILEKQLKDGVAVGDFLSARHSSKVARDADGEPESVTFDNIVDELGIIMNTQVYMPECDKWDHVTKPLVGFAPLAENAENENSIVAFDANGNQTTVNEANYKDRPILIIGPNERTLADGSLDPDVIPIESLASMPGAGKGKSMYGDVPAGRDDAPEILEYFELWKSYEPWWKGSNELRFQFSNVCCDKKFGWDDINTHSRQSPKYGLFDWSRAKCGETLHYRLWENDSGDDKLAINKSMNMNASVRADTPKGTPAPCILGLPKWVCDTAKFLWANKGFIIKLIDPVDQIGEGDIYFSDPPKEYTDSKNYVFKMNYNLLTVEATPAPEGTPIAIVTDGPGVIVDTPDPPCTTCVTPPPEVYTLNVVWVEGSGNSKSETRTGITPDSVQYINTSSGWSVDTNSPAGIKYMSFAGWNIDGSADIDNPQSSSTYVRNFRGNVRVSPTYTMN